MDSQGMKIPTIKKGWVGREAVECDASRTLMARCEQKKKKKRRKKRPERAIEMLFFFQHKGVELPRDDVTPFFGS